MARVLSRSQQWTPNLVSQARRLIQGGTLDVDETTQLLRCASSFQPGEAPELLAMELHRQLEAATTAEGAAPVSGASSGRNPRILEILIP
jgi:hypothetical protein